MERNGMNSMDNNIPKIPNNMINSERNQLGVDPNRQMEWSAQKKGQ